MKNKIRVILELVDKYTYQICIGIVIVFFTSLYMCNTLHKTLLYGIIKIIVMIISIFIWCEYNKKYLLIPILISFLWFMFVW